MRYRACKWTSSSLLVLEFGVPRHVPRQLCLRRLTWLLDMSGPGHVEKLRQFHCKIGRLFVDKREGD